MRIIKIHNKLDIRLDNIFIPIPKTGSTSLKCFINQSNISFLPHPDKHASMKMFIQHYNIRKILDAFSFTIVRNPYDRLVSLYFHILRRHKENNLHHIHDPDLQGEVPEESFRDFVFNQLERCVTLTKQQSHMILHPQTDWILYRKKKIVKRILKFEDIFFKDPSKLKHILNIKENFQLSHLNKTNHKKWPSYYDHSTQEFVYKIYEKDFALLKYSKKILTK